jgi:CBS domain-containing protein
MAQREDDRSFPMAANTAATPLSALEAVVIDTETTGLDARIARIIQIGALRIKGQVRAKAEPFQALINPGVPIPPETTRVHGIWDRDVAEAPMFQAIEPELSSFLNGAILIGHTISFDIAMLQREHQLAGRAFARRRSLDVRMLARIASPSLAKYDLDGLCAWLGVTVEGRHTALGDAVATADIYARLVPLLRQNGVRTLAEAEAACRRLAEQEARSAGGLIMVEDAPQRQQPLVKLDSYAYRHRVRDVMSAPPLFISGEATVKDAIALFAEKGVSSVFLRGGEGFYGIVTERDVLKALAREGAAALDGEVFRIASFPLETVPEEDFVYRAVGRMTRLNVRHLGVKDGAGDLVGALTPRNLLRQRASSAILLGDEIDSAASPADLGQAFAKLPTMTHGLIDEDVEPRAIAAVISTEICAMTRRAAELAEEAMFADGKGPPPCPYAVMVLGSGGRGESLLAADQDNAIVYETGEPGGVEDVWFEALAKRLAVMLDEAGVPLCKGGVMAQNALWRMSRERWLAQIDRWVGRQNPEDLLNVDIFFDGVPVHGSAALADGIRRHGCRRAAETPDFLVQLAVKLADHRAPFTLLGGLKTDEQGRIDLKKFGLMPIFTAARLLALRHGIEERATPARLRGASALGFGSAHQVEALIAAHGVLLGAMLEQQLIDTEAGMPLSPRVDAARLSKARKAEIVEALKSVAIAIDMAVEGRV